MAFASAQKSRLLVGSLAMSGYTRQFGANAPVDQLDVTTLESTASVFIPGQDTSDFALDLLFDSDTAAGGEWSTVTTWKTTPQVVSFSPEGWTLGNVALMVQANAGSIELKSTPSTPVGISVATQTDGATDGGVVIAALAAITVDTNGTSVNNGAATTNGGVAHLHVTAFSGLTSDAITVEHSTNDSVWATLGTFTTVTGTTSQRLVIAAGTTVNQYLRVVDDCTGTGSITRAVTFARR